MRESPTLFPDYNFKYPLSCFFFWGGGGGGGGSGGFFAILQREIFNCYLAMIIAIFFTI